MADREKVIKGLEMCLASIDEAECPEECPYYETCRNYENRVIFQPVMRDTLELLKEQEPVKPHVKHASDDDSWYYGCGACHKAIDYKDRFCRYCGRAVKWDG